MNPDSVQQALARLRDLLGPDGLLLPADDLQRYSDEPRGRFHGRPVAVARPASTQQVAAVVSTCGKAGLPMVPQGGLTGLVGGASVVDGQREVIVSLERMRTVREIDAAGATLVAESGCTLQRVREAAAGVGLRFPLSLASEGTATIGGNIATNAGGHMTLRYGNARRQVLGLEVVLADGRIYDGLTTLRKDNSGYDLDQWFIGSEGTLGIITAAALALVPAARQGVTVLAALDRLEAALVLLERMRRQLGENITAFEIMPRLALDFVFEYLPDAGDPMGRPWPWYVLMQADSAVTGQWLVEAGLDGLEQASRDGLVREVIVAGNDAQAELLWRMREAISPAQKCGGVSLKHDIAVPVATIPGFVEDTVRALQERVPGVRCCVFGHLADGNLHFNLSQPEGMDAETFRGAEADCNRIVFDLVRRYRGSIAAEHGIGQLRRAELARLGDPVRLELMARIRRCLDPDGLFNPGKVVDPSP